VGHKGQGLFSFPPQLVTQGSPVHGLPNKLTIRSKHTLFHFSPLNLLCLLMVLRTLAATGNGSGPISPAAWSAGYLRNVWESLLPCLHIPARGFHYGIDNSNDIISH
jgi:hypothetical protein